MTPFTRGTAIISLILSTALPARGQQYLLYVPQPVTSGVKTSSKDGVLVKEIKIQKGDTLYGLSQKYSGRGMYYPQILLFNSIPNPALIHTGITLRVPVNQIISQAQELTDTKPAVAPHKQKAAGGKVSTVKAPAKPAVSLPAPAMNTELSLSDLKAAANDKSRAGRHKKKIVAQGTKRRSVANQSLPPSPVPLPAAHSTAPPEAVETGGQKLYEAAIKAYRQDNCRTALELFDRYLADNSSSPLSADANLYKAECYLKLSTQ